jgi:sigma-E factor negative regulatory protein RseC
MNLEQQARVLSTEAGQAWVEPLSASECGTCHGGGCGSRHLAEVFQRGPRRYLADNSQQFQVGERVLVEIPEGDLLKSALWAYGLPLLMLILGAALGRALAGEAGGLLGALTSLLLASVIGRLRRNARPMARLAARLPAAGCAHPVNFHS